MRLNDLLSGILLLVFGLAVVGCAQTFPMSPGQNIGPGLFPSLIGGAFGLCGLTLFRQGLRQRGDALVVFDAWVRRPRMVLNGVLVIAAVIFYALVVDHVGFFIAAFVFLVAPLFAFGVPWRWIPLLATAVTLALHFAFYTLLRVALPWGWLEAIAW